jgi:arylsulfatase
LNEQIMAGKYPGIVKTKLDGVNQIDYLTGKSDKSAREVFFYYTGPVPSAVRYKNWKLYYNMVPSDPAGAYFGPQKLGWIQLQNIRRDPFEQNTGEDQKALGTSMGGILASPSTAYLYNWNILPIGQLLWLKELESYKEFPPLQDPASYNLDQVLQAIKTQGNRHPSQ